MTSMPEHPVHPVVSAPHTAALVSINAATVPAIIARAGGATHERYLHFFAASIRNPNTRAAYSTAAAKFFAWCKSIGIDGLDRITKLHVAAYIEQLTLRQSAPTVKQNLAALRMLFEYLRVAIDNPAEGVRGPKHVVRTGRTPVLAAEEARRLLESIDVATIAGFRDRALIALMIYFFARVSAAVGTDIGDYHMNGNRRWIRLHEKGGREHAVPVHHRAEEYIDAYLCAGNLAGTKGPLFRTIDRQGDLTAIRMNRHAAWEMVKRRARQAGIPPETTNHSFRATGITVYLENGGTIENAKTIAAHASIKTTQTYDRRHERITLDEINRIHL
jgi:site-specific recombinase XerD